MTDFSNLPIWIPKHLRRLQLSVEQLAHRTGVSRTSIYRYLYDQDRPTEHTMVKMCRALDVPFEEGLRQYTPRRIGPTPGPRPARRKRITT